MPAPSHIVTRGIVLRETEFKDADKILTLLTPDRGRISVIARGVRRKRCKYAACAQPLAWSEWTLDQRGEWYYAREGGTLMLFDGLRTDLERMALGFYFAELTEAVTGAEPAPEVLRHLLNGLYAVSELKKEPELARAAFELRLLSLVGYEPLADGCAVCGRPDPQDAVLDVTQGILHCRACTVKGNGITKKLCPAALAAMRHILYGDPRRLYAFTLGGEAQKQLSAAAEAFVSVQLERNFRTLDFYKSLRNPT